MMPEPNGGEPPNDLRPAHSRTVYWAALAWTLLFHALHVYWAVVGDFGLGPMPAAPARDAYWAWVETFIVGGMFAISPFVPLAMLASWGRRPGTWIVVASSAIAACLLGVRGVAGWIDQALRSSGVAPLGLTGLTYEQIVGRAHPPPSTLILGTLIDSDFVIGGVLFGWAAYAYAKQRRLRS